MWLELRDIQQIIWFLANNTLKKLIIYVLQSNKFKSSISHNRYITQKQYIATLFNNFGRCLKM